MSNAFFKNATVSTEAAAKRCTFAAQLFARSRRIMQTTTGKSIVTIHAKIETINLTSRQARELAENGGEEVETLVKVYEKVRLKIWDSTVFKLNGEPMPDIDPLAEGIYTAKISGSVDAMKYRVFGPDGTQVGEETQVNVNMIDFITPDQEKTPF